MGDMRVTKREVLVSVIILLLMLAIGFLISQDISSNIEEQNEVYHKALKIEDMNTYNYAKTIGVGECFATYTLDADTPQSVEELTGEYLYIERIYEEEHQKTRVVEEEYTDSDGNKKTRTKTETYWEWDIMSRDYYESPTVTINGESVDTDRIVGLSSRTESLDSSTVASNYQDRLGLSSTYLKVGSHRRWSFRVIPLHSEGSMYVDLGDGIIRSKKISLHPDIAVQDLYDSYVSSSKAGIIIFWIVWIIFTGGIIFAYCYFDNDYLEDDNGNSKRRSRYRW